MRRTKDNKYQTPDKIKNMEAMWKELYARGDIERPFNSEVFDYLTNLFGQMTATKKDMPETK